MLKNLTWACFHLCIELIKFIFNTKNYMYIPYVCLYVQYIHMPYINEKVKAQKVKTLEGS